MANQVQEIAINTLPFWSRFTLTLDTRWDGANTINTALSQGQGFKVFDYKQGDQTASALEGSQATARDTILVVASQTRGGGQFEIRGISYTKDGWAYERTGEGSKNGLIHTIFPPASVQPGNGVAGPVVPTVEDWRSFDSFFTNVFLNNFRTQVNIDGTKRILEMGPVPYYPGVGGASGGNVDTENGATFVHNYMEIPELIVWNPAGTTDSNITVLLECTYDVLIPTWTTPDGTDRNGTPILGANPTALGRLWTQGWICNFHGVEKSPLSDVS
jgi:hypothetical protein